MRIRREKDNFVKKRPANWIIKEQREKGLNATLHNTSIITHAPDERPQFECTPFLVSGLHNEKREGIKSVIRRMQFSQLFVIHLTSKKTNILCYIFAYLPYLVNLWVPIGKKPALGDHETDVKNSLLRLKDLIPL